MSEEKVSRRNYAKVAGAGIIGIAIGAAGGYYGAPKAPSETITKTETVTVTQGVTPTPTVPSKKEWWEFYEEAASPYKGATLQVIAVSGQRMEDSLLGLGQDFEELTGISVEVTPLSWDAGHEKVASDFVAGAGAYDGATIDGWVMADFTLRGYIDSQERFLHDPKFADPNLNFDDLVKKDIELNCTWQNEFYGFPFMTDVTILYYRKDLFDEYKLTPPETWPEYNDIAKFFAEEVSDIYGASLQLKRGIDSPSPFMMRYGGPFDQFHPIVDNKYGKQAFTWTKDVLPYAAPGTLEYDSADSGDAFLRGDVAMNANWGFLAGKAVDPSASNVVDTWAAAAIPKGLDQRTPFLGGWVLSTLANSKNKEATFLFFEYASTPENMKKIALDPSMGTVPSRTSVLSDSDIVAKFPHYPAFVDSLESSIARPSVPEFLEMWDRLTIAYTDYLTDQKELDDATAWCQAEWDELLA